jgi:hypothetical protein
MAPKGELVRTEHERDEARRALARSQEEALLAQAELEAAREREELQVKAWNTIESADGVLRALQGEATTAATPKEQRKLTKSITELKERRAALDREVRKVPMQRGSAWPRFKRSFLITIDDLERAVAAGLD